MKKFYSLVILFSFLLMTAQAAFVGGSMLLKKTEFDEIVDTAKRSQKNISKITDTRPGKPSDFKSVKIVLPPFQPKKATSNNTPSSQQSNIKNAASDLKVLSNVKIFPNPVADHLNLSFFVNKDSNVTIKIMDVLGNEITTLLSQRLSAGEQMNSFPISSSFNSGYYFVRLIVGKESVVKRISIL
ncbi:MAG TPA: T9SS type A sorting domain-containing protein [Pedobacter sp.]